MVDSLAFGLQQPRKLEVRLLIWSPVGIKLMAPFSGQLNHITSLAFGCFAVVKGIAAIVGPIIAASLHDRSNHAKTIYGGFGFRNVEIFVGMFSVYVSVILAYR